MALHYGVSDKEVNEILPMPKRKEDSGTRVYISIHDLTNLESMGIGHRQQVIANLSNLLADAIESLKDGESFTVEFERVDMTPEGYAEIADQ